MKKLTIVLLAALITICIVPVAAMAALKPMPLKVLSAFSTSLGGSSANRISNIKLAASKINMTLVKPGQEFSFNKIIGNTNRVKDGWKDAPVIVNKKHVEGLGGGICQVSGTLYNAVTKAGLTVTEIHHHSIGVPYLPKGKDATISYGYYDFKFKNKTKYPVKLRTYVSGGKMIVEFYQTK
jgi:vancomycin resistance protein VanW